MGKEPFAVVVAIIWLTGGTRQALIARYLRVGD